MAFNNKIASVYSTKPEYMATLHQELGQTSEIIGDLVFSSEKKQDVCFALDCWLDPQIISFTSISQAVNQLRAAGKYWYLHPLSHIRRSRLIEAQLRQCRQLNQPFPLTTAIPTIGVFSLLNQHTLIYATQRWKKWPQGHCYFIEDKINPPNRAYLKLWEALTLLERYPKPGDSALDLGASPGGWSYVMQSLGAQVTAVDKAPLAPSIATRANITYLQQSAFALDPSTLPQSYEWVLSDIACYPERAYALIMKWIASRRAKQLIFTIKLQGETDLAIIKQLQAIPNSRVVHLFYNKHEATFFYPAIGCSHVV